MQLQDAGDDRLLRSVIDPDRLERLRRGGRALRSVEVSEIRETHRSEEHTSELQSLMRISYAVFCLQKKICQTYKRVTQPQHHNKQNRNAQYRTKINNHQHN